MATKRKIKIDDSDALRATLDALYENASQTALARWALKLATRSLAAAGHTIHEFDAVAHGFTVNEAWQKGQARVHDVRHAGFQIHEIAKRCDDALLKTALRVAGQAVGTGHMREHAMVASDYAVKAINILHPGDRDNVTRERLWQIDALKQECDAIQS